MRLGVFVVEEAVAVESADVKLDAASPADPPVSAPPGLGAHVLGSLHGETEGASDTSDEDKVSVGDGLKAKGRRPKTLFTLTKFNALSLSESTGSRDDARIKVCLARLKMEAEEREKIR